MTLYAIETGRFLLDGGAMFGVVPRTLWSRTNPPDSANRIAMAARCLLIEDGERLILIDTGIGTKVDARFRELYGLDDATQNLDRGLQRHGFHRKDITDVVLTHLHFDHCGGTTAINHTTGRSEVGFGRARVHVSARQLAWALEPNPREKASFFAENIQPLVEYDSLEHVYTEHDLEPLGLQLLVSDGHTEGMICPLVRYNGYTVLFAADFIPTHGHLPLPYVMSYDVRPLVSMDERAEWLPRIVNENIVVFFEHDPEVECCTVAVDDRGKYSVKDRLTLANLT
ncbi:MAG: MBL fold metallo-hydrolase [Bacteroidia bacterium]|nr:MBL fold metallo-hydrolase [Bacteroidia bacterium]